MEVAGLVAKHGGMEDTKVKSQLEELKNIVHSYAKADIEYDAGREALDNLKKEVGEDKYSSEQDVEKAFRTSRDDMLGNIFTRRFEEHPFINQWKGFQSCKAEAAME